MTQFYCVVKNLKTFTFFHPVCRGPQFGMGTVLKTCQKALVLSKLTCVTPGLKRSFWGVFRILEPDDDLLSREPALSLARKRFTVLFGMGRWDHFAMVVRHNFLSGLRLGLNQPIYRVDQLFI